MFPSLNKAQAEFNWILVLIAGIVILISFVAFAVDYKSLSDRRINTELSLALSSQLDSLTFSGLTTEINPQGLTLFDTRFSCDSVWINNAVPIPVVDKVIFSSNHISSDKLLLWVDEFSLPYKISNIYYISSPKIKYYILYDDSTSQIAQSLYSSFPTTQDDKQFFNVKLISQLSKQDLENDINKEGLREVRIAVFNDIDKPELSVKTKVIRLSNNLNLGQVYYPSTNEASQYIKKQLIIAAIFSDNYKCNLDKLLGKVKNINAIYSDKASRLFFKTQSISKQCNYQLFISSIANTNTDDLPSLLSLEQALIGQNQELNKKGCQDVF